jgi:twitching motility protein PilT
MDLYVQWLSHLCLKEGVLTKYQLKSIFDQAGEHLELQGMIDSLVENGYCTNNELLQELIDKSWTEASEGNPVPETEELTEASEDESLGLKNRPAEVSSENINDYFSQVETMSDDEIAAFMLGLIHYADERGASDLHLSAAGNPFLRIQRKIHYLSETPLTELQSKRLNTILLTNQQKKILEEDMDLDFALQLQSLSRYRVNLMVTKNGIGGTYRIVPSSVMTLEELGFKNADIIKNLLTYHNGLILITGPMGMGKTTTLAATIKEINEKREDHIITVEDPIEIVQESGNCIVTQRQVGAHTNSFATALKGALREDPDIIVIGELRDLETIEMAITASETGHLVIGTMHTSDATTTLNRLLDVFPPSQQNQIRAMTAESLRGIICQRLLPAKDGGVVLAYETLINVTAVSSMVRDGKEQGINSVIETGSRKGMISMDNCVLQLYKEGKITQETALDNIKNKAIRSQVTTSTGGSSPTPPPPSGGPKTPPPPAPKKKGFFSK